MMREQDEIADWSYAMPTFKVTIEGLAFVATTMTVDAPDADAAKATALEVTGDADWSWQGVDDESLAVTGVRPTGLASSVAGTEPGALMGGIGFYPRLDPRGGDPATAAFIDHRAEGGLRHFAHLLRESHGLILLFAPILLLAELGHRINKGLN